MKPVRVYKIVEKTYRLGEKRVRLGAQAVDSAAVLIHLDEQADLAMAELVTLEKGPLGGLVFAPQTPPPEAEKALPEGPVAGVDMATGAFNAGLNRFPVSDVEATILGGRAPAKLGSGVLTPGGFINKEHCGSDDAGYAHSDPPPEGVSLEVTRQEGSLGPPTAEVVGLPDLRGSLQPVPEAWAPPREKARRKAKTAAPAQQDPGDDEVAFPPG